MGARPGRQRRQGPAGGCPRAPIPLFLQRLFAGLPATRPSCTGRGAVEADAPSVRGRTRAATSHGRACGIAMTPPTTMRPRAWRSHLCKRDVAPRARSARAARAPAVIEPSSSADLIRIVHLSTLSLDGRAVSPLREVCDTARTVPLPPPSRSRRARCTEMASPRITSDGPDSVFLSATDVGPRMHLITRTTHERACWASARARREPTGCEGGKRGQGETGLPGTLDPEQIVDVPQDWDPEEAPADGH